MKKRIRSRVKELRFIKASELVPHEQNWRVHPPAQVRALEGLLSELGYADALIGRVLPDGRIGLIDGHLRQQVTPDMEVPVLITDLNEEETAKLLITLDPLATMAGKDDEKLKELLAGVEFQSKAVGVLLEAIAGQEAWQAIESPPEMPEPASRERKPTTCPKCGHSFVP